MSNSEAQRLGGDPLRPPGGEQWDDERYERLGLTRDHVSRMWARYVDQTQPPPPHIANLIIGVTSDVHKALAQQADGGTAGDLRCKGCDIPNGCPEYCRCSPQALTEEREPLSVDRIIAAAEETRSADPGRDGYILPVTFARAIEAAHGISAAGINKKGG
jgi:hypothetical protein